jgi:hypothetical protein
MNINLIFPAADEGKRFKGVYSDEVRKPDFGGQPLEIVRVTDVAPDDQRGVWVATHLETGTVLHESPSRDECIEEEVKALNKSMKAGGNLL